MQYSGKVSWFRLGRVNFLPSSWCGAVLDLGQKNAENTLMLSLLQSSALTELRTLLLALPYQEESRGAPGRGAGRGQSQDKVTPRDVLCHMGLAER